MRYCLIILSAIALLFVAFACKSQIAIDSLPALDKVQSIDEIAKPFVDAEGTHALAIGIYQNGEMSYHNYGTISEEKAVAPDEFSMFEIGSISKTFTTGILAQMVEEGKVQLNDPISKYLPDGIGDWEEDVAITLEELATHSSGMPRVPGNMTWQFVMNMSNPYSKYTVENLYDFLKKYEPKAKSEREPMYSNLGMGLLGHILALVNGTDYETLVQQYISTPLAMSRTTITLDAWHKEHWADGHDEAGKPTSNWDIPTLAGAGAIRSNTSDMLKYLKANINNELAFESTHQPRKELYEKVGVGLAWIETASGGGQTVTWHNGGTGGFRAFAGFVKDKDIAVVAFSNTAVSVDEIGILILDYLDNSKQQQQRKVKSMQLDSLYNNLFQQGKFNGNVLVAESGNIIFEKAYGMADIENQVALNPSTSFELASVSKQFTAMGIVQLEKEGKLSLEDEMSKYIPELVHYDGITIKHLLIHTGGMADYFDLAEKYWDKAKIATNDDIIRLFQKHQPERLFQPNESYEYSNTGYLLLGSIIERVSGKTFENYLSEKIFLPLDMQNTFVYRRRYEPRTVENYAQGYVYSDSLARKVLPDELASESYVIYLDGIVGDGMVNSNIYDLLKWDRALYSNKLINEEDKKHIFSSYKTSNDDDTNYGFGWGIDNTKDYGKIASHAGGWVGYITYIERHLDNDKTIIILQNQVMDEIALPRKKTRKILYNIPMGDSSLEQKNK